MYADKVGCRPTTIYTTLNKLPGDNTVYCNI